MNEQVFYIEQWRFKENKIESFNISRFYSKTSFEYGRSLTDALGGITVAYFRIKLKDKNA